MLNYRLLKKLFGKESQKKFVDFENKGAKISTTSCIDHILPIFDFFSKCFPKLEVLYAKDRNMYLPVTFSKSNRTIAKKAKLLKFECFELEKKYVEL